MTPSSGPASTKAARPVVLPSPTILAIVNEIVQQHGADLTITDARPRGSAAAQGMGPGALFTVRFALSRPDSGQAGAPGDTLPPPAG